MFLKKKKKNSSIPTKKILYKAMIKTKDWKTWFWRRKGEVGGGLNTRWTKNLTLGDGKFI